MQGKMPLETWLSTGAKLLVEMLEKRQVAFPEFVNALESLLRRYKERKGEEEGSRQPFAVIVPFPTRNRETRETKP